MDKKFLSVKDLDCYKSAFDLSNKIWTLVTTWSYFEKDTIGKQFVRSIDSISANIAEGFGRFTKKDKIRFYQISKGLLQESIDWLDRAKARKIINDAQYLEIKREMENLPKQSINLLNIRILL